MFMQLVQDLRAKGGLVIRGLAGMFRKKRPYLLTHHGATFAVKTDDPIPAPIDVKVERTELLTGISV